MFSLYAQRTKYQPRQKIKQNKICEILRKQFDVWHLQSTQIIAFYEKTSGRTNDKIESVLA